MGDPDLNGRVTIAALRTFSVLVTVSYMLGGFLVFGLFLWIFAHYQEPHVDIVYVISVSVIMLIYMGICCVLVIWTFFGSPITLYIYGCILACMCVLTLTSCLSIGIYHDTIRKDMETGFNMTLITSDPPNVNMLFLQEHLKCCGVNNYTDWVILSPKRVIPKSCCIYEEPCVTSNYNDVYQEGCSKKMAMYIDRNLVSITVGALALTLLPAVGALFTCYLGYYMETMRNCRRDSDTVILK